LNKVSHPKAGAGAEMMVGLRCHPFLVRCAPRLPPTYRTLPVQTKAGSIRLSNWE